MAFLPNGPLAIESFVLSGRALALAVLAKALVKAVVKRLFGERSGIALFHENYDADRLPPVSEEERAELPSFSRCIACGRCDVGEAPRIAASRGQYAGLMSFVLNASRSMPDFDAAALALDFVPVEVLARKEPVCPTGVPFVALARFVRAKAAEMREPPRVGALVTLAPRELGDGRSS
jgi:hypothetical protein